MRIFGEFADFELGLWEFLELGYVNQNLGSVKVGICPSVQDRRADADRTEFGPRPVRSIFWDRRSRFGPID